MTTHNTEIATTHRTNTAASWAARLLLAAVCAGAGLAGTASAQGKDAAVTVPFPFVVGSKTLPAGDYVVRRLDANVLMIVGVENGKSASVVAVPSNERVKSRATENRFLFHRYNGTYFLAEVRRPDASTAVCLPATDAEERLARAGEASEPVAVLDRKPAE